MSLLRNTLLGLALVAPVCWPLATAACTNFIASKSATVDGSVIVTYTCDGEFHPQLTYTPAADHGPDDYFEIKTWGGEVRGQVKQPAHTYAVVRLMNEHQLTIGETTTTGREELANPDGLIHYWHLMQLTLQRARTAREAIKVMGDLVAEYGYNSTAESFMIGDHPSDIYCAENAGANGYWLTEQLPKLLNQWLADNSRAKDLTINDLERPLTFQYFKQSNTQEHLIRLTGSSQTQDATVLETSLPITKRESEVLFWVAQGKTNREIATILSLSHRTINKHLEQIFPKLNVDNRTSAATAAIKALSEA